MSESEYVSIKELAETLGMDRSHARKYVLKLGYKPLRMRTPESRGSKCLVLPRDEAEQVITRRKSEGFVPVASANGRERGEHGYFYAIQLVPELAPNRIKLGFAESVEQRLAEHRTASPTAQCLKAWPCRRTWEFAAIASITRVECRLVANEVFECENVESLLSRAEEFFGLMPAPSGRVELSEHSPLKERRENPTS